MKTAPFFQWANTLASRREHTGYMAYESQLLVFHPLVGPAIGARFQWRTLSPAPWSYQQVSVAWLTGLGGVVHGQSTLQPLSNPYQ